MTTIAITATASVLPPRVISNVEIGDMLIAGADPDDESAAEHIQMVKDRSVLIEKKTGLRARRGAGRNRE